jgi:hypothetical protein
VVKVSDVSEEQDAYIMPNIKPPLKWDLKDLAMGYDTQNYWGFGLCQNPSNSEHL